MSGSARIWGRERNHFGIEEMKGRKKSSDKGRAEATKYRRHTKKGEWRIIF